VPEVQASDLLHEPRVKARSWSPVAIRLGAQEHDADGESFGERDRAQLGRRGADEKRIPCRKRTTEPRLAQPCDVTNTAMAPLTPFPLSAEPTRLRQAARAVPQTLGVAALQAGRVPAQSAPSQPQRCLLSCSFG